MATAPPIADPRKPATQPSPARPQNQTPVGRQASGPRREPGRGAGTQTGPTTGQQRADRMALRAKMALSQPGDPAEREADRVAEQVARSPRPGEASAPSSPSGPSAPSAPSSPSAVPAAQDIHRAVGAAAAASPGLAVSADAQQAIEAQRGQGASLPPAARADMEGRLGQDLSAVRLHTDTQAQALCEQLQARAFTVGNDVFFAPGEFDPASDRGRALLAHELTHVVQQSESPRLMVQRGATSTTSTSTTTSPPPPPPSGAASGGGSAPTPPLTVPSLPIPTYKFRTNRYQTASLMKAKEYNRTGADATHQRHTWDRAVNPAQVEAKLRNTVGMTQPDHTYMVASNPRSLGGRPVGDAATIARGLLRPWWTAAPVRGIKHEVDHVIELQLSGWPRIRTADAMSNYELVDERSNGLSGGEIDRALVAEVRTAAPAASVGAARTVMSSRDIIVSSVTDSGTLANASQWSQDQIEAGAHIDAVTSAPPGRSNPVEFWDIDDPTAHGQFSAPPASLNTESIKGSSNKFIIYYGRTGGSSAALNYASADPAAPSPVLNSPRGLFMHGFQVDQVTFHRGRTNRADAVGTVRGRVFRQQAAGGRVYTTLPVVDWPVRSMSTSQFAGYLDAEDLRNLISFSLNFMSPLQFNSVDLDPEAGLVARGKVLPSLPFLQGADIDIVMAGNDLRLEKYFGVEELRLPAPLQLDTCTLGVSLGTESGLRFSGDLAFRVEGLGQGRFTGRVGTTGEAPEVELEGQFDFDSQLFDRATVQAWYRQSEFGLSGDIGIDTPGKIRGIESASLNVLYQGGNFSATGTVAPSIPGVEQGSLRVSYSEEEGLMIGGALELSANPAIRSGSVDVTLRKQAEAWRVAASGTAQPAIPGIDSTLSVSYDNGAFDASFSGSFARGMLSGTVEVGATNRSLDEQGQPTGDPLPDAPIVVYGSGSTTLQIAPWLQATAGIRFAPNGEVTVSGEIGLPGEIELFPRQEIDKTLFSLATQIPIVPGVVAEVGGNLKAEAGIGPGVLDQMRIGVEYNPEHEENTHVTGDAHVNVPADAGLRLAARAGIGLGITGASATGGIELGGALGIEGAAEAGVHIDWMPSQGLTLEAHAGFHAQPRFRFDISGYVSVTGLGFSIYDNTWELAAYEVGSDLRFGVNFPVRYVEGEPFAVSLDDVEFEVPDIDPAAIVDEVAAEIF